MAVVHVGPWGGKGGQSWGFKTKGGKINQINVTTNGSVINSLDFFYTDKDGQSLHAGPYGTLATGNGTGDRVLRIADDEFLTAISGTFGMWSGLKVITSLKFKTNKGGTGLLGNKVGASFSLPVTGTFEGFFGTGGGAIDSIGVAIRP